MLAFTLSDALTKIGPIAVLAGVGILIRWAARGVAAGPFKIDAEPTLRGLRVKSGRDAHPMLNSVYPWEQLDWDTKNNETFWRVYDEHGALVTIDHRPLHLLVGTKQLQTTARRAQRRRMFQLWNAGQLKCLESHADGETEHGAWVIMPGLLLMNLVMYAGLIRVWFFPRADMDRNVQILFTAIAFPGMLMFTVAPLTWLWWTRSQGRRPNVVHLAVDHRGFTARLRNGEQISATWELVADSEDRLSIIRCTLRDGRRLVIPRTTRAALVFGFAAKRFLPDLFAAQIAAQKHPLAMGKAGWYALAGAMLVGAALYAGHNLGVTWKTLLAGPGLYFAGGILGVGAIGAGLMWLQRVAHRQGRRQQRKEKAEHAQPLAPSRNR
jgi:hypothetical protein